MQLSNAQLRAGAVAKLKRAASLPRVNGGRRPPMHPEGTSEGEKSKDDASSKHEDDSSKNATSDERDDPERQQPRLQQELQEQNEQANEQHELPNGQLPQRHSPSPKRRRRSRSRSRSRSKEIKDLKPPQSPPPRDSSPDEKLVYPPAFDDAPVISPAPLLLAGITMGPRTPVSPSAVSPSAASPTPSPQTSVPTLQDLQQRLGAGLFRSQSARAAAMIKLTGGTPSLETSQSQPLASSLMSRSNTVAGLEQRAAARERMLGRLQHRVGAQTEELMTSGGEDAIPPRPAPRRRRSRRRSRRSSAAGSGGASSSAVEDLDERDPPSTSPNTPIVPPSPVLLPSLPQTMHPESSQPPQIGSQENARLNVPASPNHQEIHMVDADNSNPASVSQEQWTFGSHSPRDVLVEEDPFEEEDTDDPSGRPPQSSPSPPSPPPRDSQDSFMDVHLAAHVRVPHSTDASSSNVAVSSRPPGMSSADNPQSSQGSLLASPFSIPLKERLHDEEEEEIVYRDEMRDGMKARRVWGGRVPNGNGIPWPSDFSTDAALIPVQNEEEELDKLSAPPIRHQQSTPPALQDPRTLEFASSSPGGTSYAPPSPSSVLALSHSTATTRESVESSLGPSPGLANFPNKTGIFAQRESFTDTGTDWEESGGIQTDRESTAKRGTDGTEKSSTWAKVKSTLVGRRSRANSTSKREEKTANRESGASGVSGNQSKASEQGGISTAPPSAWSSPGLMHAQLAHEQYRVQSQEHHRMQERQFNIQTSSAWSSPGLGQAQLTPLDPLPRQLPMQTPAASASNISLGLAPSHRGAPSPVPLASPADLSKYADAKLMPFPGLVKLDEERKKQRSRRISASASSPNLPRDLSATPTEPSNGARPLEMEVRERKLSHQYSDSGLLQKFRNVNAENISQLTVSTSSQATLPASSGAWLPMTRKEVTKWYKVNKFFNTSSSSVATAPVISPPIIDGRFEGKVGNAQKKPSLSDILVNHESGPEWEDSPSVSTPKGKGKERVPNHQDRMASPPDSFAAPQGTSRIHSQQDSLSSSDSIYRRDSEGDAVSSRRSPTRPALSVIQEPSSSDFSRASSASQASHNSAPLYNISTSPDTPVGSPDRCSLVLQRLDSLLSRDPNDALRWAFLDDPPRKLIMSSSVTQVVNSETIRERFLFLFNDILVVAKPLQPADKAMDRMFIVKNIIDLQTVQVITNRDEGVALPVRHPLVEEFVGEFSINADSAVANLLQNSRLEEDEAALGKLLFNTFELDRTCLGDYLSRKSHKAVLRAYIDCFGFSGVRLDYALRTFILSLGLPAETPEHPLEHLLNVFASKWFEANARLVSFDKDLATKLVRLIFHLDGQIHKSGGQPQINGFGPRDFRAEWERMVRALDPRGLLLPDELILDIYYSLRRDPLRWAADTQFRRPPQSIVFKRPPPNRLVHRVLSDPITLRIAHPDPQLRIQLHSQDGLIFDPPELSFTRSMEVTFRVTGTTLGPKSIVFSLVGLNAPFYSGIPFSKTIIIERHFMRNTFQVAFDDQRGAKRRYMFSSEDALFCHQWALSLRQPSLAAKPNQESDSSESRRLQKATRAVSLDILREAATRRLSGHELYMLCRQNSLIPAVLPTVTIISPSS